MDETKNVEIKILTVVRQVNESLNAVLIEINQMKNGEINKESENKIKIKLKNIEMVQLRKVIQIIIALKAQYNNSEKINKAFNLLPKQELNSKQILLSDNNKMKSPQEISVVSNNILYWMEITKKIINVLT